MGIYLSPGFNREENTVHIKSPQCEFICVGIDFKNKAEVLDIAKDLVNNGVQLIELCGGFGPLWIAKVTEAIQGKVPVGSTVYGPEARRPMLDILSNE